MNSVADLLGETIEAAIIVSVLLSFVEQLMTSGKITSSTTTTTNGRTSSPSDSSNDGVASPSNGSVTKEESDLAIQKTLIKRMRIQIWAGTLAGFFVALCIGAAFIAVVRPNKIFSRVSTYGSSTRLSEIYGPTRNKFGKVSFPSLPLSSFTLWVSLSSRWIDPESNGDSSSPRRSNSPTAAQ